MREQPSGDELLSCARDYLKTNVLPDLDGEKKYCLLMVMNAMSIVSRQLCKGGEHEKKELENLRLLVNDPKCDLLEGNRLLACILRAGAADPGQADQSELLKHLWKVTEQRVSESNPKALNE